MKFRARIVEVKLMSDLLKALEKVGVSKKFVLVLDKERIEMILIGEGVSEQIRSFAEFPTNKVFDNFKIENNKADHKIYLKLRISNLQKCFRTIRSGEDIIVKLSKVDRVACLVFSLSISDISERQGGRARQVYEPLKFRHNCPVRIYKDLDALRVPNSNERRSVCLPSDGKRFQSVLEGTAKCGGGDKSGPNAKITISKNLLRFSVKDSIKKLELEFQQLEHPQTPSSEAISQKPELENMPYHAYIDLRHLINCLYCYGVEEISEANLIICERCVVVFISSETGAEISYFIPRKTLGSD